MKTELVTGLFAHEVDAALAARAASGWEREQFGSSQDAGTSLRFWVLFSRAVA
jgi:hypothetical protein